MILIMTNHDDDDNDDNSEYYKDNDIRGAPLDFWGGGPGEEGVGRFF